MKKWFYKAFSDYKDIFFNCYLIVWFMFGMMHVFVFKCNADDITLFNMGMILIFGGITLVTFISNKFRRWLNTKVDKNN